MQVPFPRRITLNSAVRRPPRTAGTALIPTPSIGAADISATYLAWLVPIEIILLMAVAWCSIVLEPENFKSTLRF